MIGLVIEISKHAPENVGTYYDIRGTAAYQMDNSPARSPVSRISNHKQVSFCAHIILLLACTQQSGPLVETQSLLVYLSLMSGHRSRSLMVDVKNFSLLII